MSTGIQVLGSQACAKPTSWPDVTKLDNWKWQQTHCKQCLSCFIASTTSTSLVLPYHKAKKKIVSLFPDAEHWRGLGISSGRQDQGVLTKQHCPEIWLGSLDVMEASSNVQTSGVTVQSTSIVVVLGTKFLITVDGPKKRSCGTHPDKKLEASAVRDEKHQKVSGQNQTFTF